LAIPGIFFSFGLAYLQAGKDGLGKVSLKARICITITPVNIKISCLPTQNASV